jgi:glycosyltransferase involved in cell wall biosynthesis
MDRTPDGPASGLLSVQADEAVGPTGHGPMAGDEIPPPGSRRGICIVGAGWRFTSGISYYTCQLANAFADQHDVSVIPMRQLMPRRFYPGRRRVGEPRARMAFRPDVPVCDGVDWWWGRSLMKAVSFLAAHRPEVLVLQWWTATVLHTYLVLAVLGRLLGSRVVVELHEVQDTGEARFAPVRLYGRWGLRALLRMAQGCVVHSAADQEVLRAEHGTMATRIAVAPHGPFDQYRPQGGRPAAITAAIAAVQRAPRSAVNLLFFGTIRPYKGLEDLLKVFNGFDAGEVSDLWLTVVGETWEGCTEPARLIAASPHRERITFVNDYVPDEVVSAAFGHADIAVLPYRRSSSSGPLHVAMSWGLPVVVTRVGGLPEAAAGYDGAIWVPPGDERALAAAIRNARQLVGRRFADPRSWAESIDALLSAAGLPAGHGHADLAVPELAAWHDGGQL